MSTNGSIKILLSSILALRTIGAVVERGSTVFFCAGSPTGCMKTGKFQDGYLEIGCEVRQFYLNVRILFGYVALNTS